MLRDTQIEDMAYIYKNEDNFTEKGFSHCLEKQFQYFQNNIRDISENQKSIETAQNVCIAGSLNKKIKIIQPYETLFNQL